MEEKHYTYATDPIRLCYMENVMNLQLKIEKLQDEMREQAKLLYDYDRRNYPHLVVKNNEEAKNE